MRTVLTMILLLALSGVAIPQKADRDEGREDVPAQMVRAEQALKTAKSELSSAGDEWGGHRVAAMKHVDAALQEINKGMQWARQHKEIK